MHLRPIRASDVSFAWELVRDSAAPHVGAYELPRNRFVEHCLRIAAAESPLAWLAFEGRDIIGFVELHREAEAGWIDEIVVAPASRGRGIGKLLLAHAETEFRERGASCVRLATFVTNTGALRFYERQGFIREGTRVLHAELPPQIVLAKKLR